MVTKLPNHTRLLPYSVHTTDRLPARLTARTQRLESGVPIAIAIDALQYLAISVTRTHEPFPRGLCSFALLSSKVVTLQLQFLWSRPHNVNGAATPETATPGSTSPATHGAQAGKAWECRGNCHTSQPSKWRRCIRDMRKSGVVERHVSNGFGNRRSEKRRIF